MTVREYARAQGFSDSTEFQVETHEDEARNYADAAEVSYAGSTLRFGTDPISFSSTCPALSPDWEW